MKNKFILGTVQLGIAYGINNKLGKPTRQEAFNILDLAYKSGIQTLDCADGYGEALEVIGAYFNETGKYFNVINKFKIDGDQLSKKLQNTLSSIHQKSLYCYMYHQFNDYSSGNAAKELNELKLKGIIQKVGLSLYNTEELRQVVHDPDIEIIQLPVNILDLDDEKKILLQTAKKNGKEIHARSVYLQGLFFKDPDLLVGRLVPMKIYLKKVRLLAARKNIDLKKILLNFVLQKEYVDYVVMGIEQASQLQDNLKITFPYLDYSDIEEIQLPPEDRYLLNPANWK